MRQKYIRGKLHTQGSKLGIKEGLMLILRVLVIIIQKETLTIKWRVEVIMTTTGILHENIILNTTINIEKWQFTQRQISWTIWPTKRRNFRYNGWKITNTCPYIYYFYIYTSIQWWLYWKQRINQSKSIQRINPSKCMQSHNNSQFSSISRSYRNSITSHNISVSF